MDLYEILEEFGIKNFSINDLFDEEKNRTIKEDINKKFRKYSLKHHPDRAGGDWEKFAEFKNRRDFLFALLDLVIDVEKNNRTITESLEYEDKLSVLTSDIAELEEENKALEEENKALDKFIAESDDFNFIRAEAYRIRNLGKKSEEDLLESNERCKKLESRILELEEKYKIKDDIVKNLSYLNESFKDEKDSLVNRITSLEAEISIVNFLISQKDSELKLAKDKEEIRENIGGFSESLSLKDKVGSLTKIISEKTQEIEGLKCEITKLNDSLRLNTGQRFKFNADNQKQKQEILSKTDLISKRDKEIYELKNQVIIIPILEAKLKTQQENESSLLLDLSSKEDKIDELRNLKFYLKDVEIFMNTTMQLSSLIFRYEDKYRNADAFREKFYDLNASFLDEIYEDKNDLENVVQNTQDIRRFYQETDFLYNEFFNLFKEIIPKFMKSELLKLPEKIPFEKTSLEKSNEEMIEDIEARDNTIKVRNNMVIALRNNNREIKEQMTDYHVVAIFSLPVFVVNIFFIGSVIYRKFWKIYENNYKLRMFFKLFSSFVFLLDIFIIYLIFCLIF